MKELIEMLRYRDDGMSGNDVFTEAADAIESLQAENALLKSQLDEFVYCEENPNYVSDGDKLTKCRAENERLRAALNELRNRRGKSYFMGKNK